MTDQEDRVADQAARVLREVEHAPDEPSVPETDPERTRELRTPGFSRMVAHTDWTTEDRAVVNGLRDVVDGRILTRFAGAYQIMSDIYDAVREPEVDGNGEVVKDHLGFTVWKRQPTGAYIEDFGRLTNKEREDALYRITTSLFEWEQVAADVWGEAMFAKAQWEERFAIAFQIEHQGKDTIEGRTQSGRLGARDERYFAIFMSLYSRKADAIVRTMERLGQRLKDTLP